MILAFGNITHPHENLACTIARMPSFGPKTALEHYEVSIIPQRRIEPTRILAIDNT
jgi:hypothetical protein